MVIANPCSPLDDIWAVMIVWTGIEIQLIRTKLLCVVLYCIVLSVDSHQHATNNSKIQTRLLVRFMFLAPFSVFRFNKSQIFFVSVLCFVYFYRMLQVRLSVGTSASDCPERLVFVMFYCVEWDCLSDNDDDDKCWDSQFLWRLCLISSSSSSRWWWWLSVSASSYTNPFALAHYSLAHSHIRQTIKM